MNGLKSLPFPETFFLELIGVTVHMELTVVSNDAIVALAKQKQTRMWANAKYRWCPLFNAAKFG